jgi:Protein of unknown function (DUF3455)
MSRARRISVGVVVAALTAIGIGAAAPADATVGYPGVPDNLRAPDGNKLVAVFHAHGVQTYQCTNNSWVFVQPDAILSSFGRAQVLHTKGPVWTDVDDGSSVGATAVANSPVPGSIPQLLLKATSNRGPGKLAHVTYVQRLRTKGGAAPTGSCGEGVTTSVPYSADYTFYDAK